MSVSRQAVVFDLFGTLVPNLDPVVHNRVLAEVACILAVPVEAFLPAWHRTFAARMNGTLRDGPAMFRPVLEALGVQVEADALARASELRRSALERALVPKPGALDVLDALSQRGLRLALATDCSSETPDLLDRTPLGRYFPVRACSAHLGVCKPHAAMYQHVLDALGLTGSACWYVGDGNSEELPGARRHGMTTVWVDNGAAQHFKERFVPEGEHRITDLRELLGVLDGMTDAQA